MPVHKGAATDLDHPVTPAELTGFCRERLAGFETPKAIVFTDSLPDTVGGKVLKYKLRVTYGGLYDT